ncbi:LacI family DNA-binding transcriptional regulator [Halothermothrix orenii]|uniref:Transcriptional regulator, LacI family n=1 Tax=Halothermothrix orenii (strain H 168 / OCM 544 / DSM 9562) TaxID=373903 RepID=B8D1V1_HALOH|nr:LacI family DNA-binding transcriptional regulator [Halothermothrix orenii]ACL69178.1 transcriptional regulator, LacI family [Halothermothrix orenii H 168]
MATIKDIAKIAGVSTATVSRVINNYPDVSEKTKKKILKIMKENNYRPNSVARSLSTSKSNIIGIFFTDHFNTGIHHPFFREVIYGLEKIFDEKGYDILYFTNRKWGENFSYVEKCHDRQVDGVVLMGVPKTDSNIPKLLDSDIPTVFVDLDIVGKKASYVISDNYRGAEMAVNYLHSLGHTRIGMIMGISSTKVTNDRLLGYQTAIKNLGLVYNSQWILDGRYTEEGGYQAMSKYLEMDERPTAIFCQSDSMAIGAMQAIHEAGMSVPEDFSLIGFDDIEVSRYVNPALTTIKQDKIGLGRAAGELLINIVENENESQAPVILPVELVKRDSCGRPNLDMV